MDEGGLATRPHPLSPFASQVVNRDLSCAVLNVFAARRAAEIDAGALKPPRSERSGKKPAPGEARGPPPKPAKTITVLEGLAATGLRAIRYALEVEAVARVVANDADPAAVASIARNVAANGGAAAAKVEPSLGDARTACLNSASSFDVVDLDPYGSPAIFLESALIAIAHGGLLAVTATDMAVLCGANPGSAYAKYGAFPLHRPYGHEQGLRILLAAVEAAAARAGKGITPVLSVSVDFYIRVFVRVHTSPAAAKLSSTRLSTIWQSTGCDSFALAPLGRTVSKGGKPALLKPGGPADGAAVCPETGARMVLGGPIWNGPLHDPAWVADLMKEVDAPARYPAAARVRALLASVAEELPDAPLYYNVHDLCRTVKCTPPPADAIRSALVNAGHRVSGTHANPLGLKTDAPSRVVWDVMRCWVAAHPLARAPEAGSPAAALLAKEPELKANFSRAPGALSAARGAKVARFLPNPEPFWGPKARAGTGAKAQRQAAANDARAAAKAAMAGDARKSEGA